MKEFKLLDDWVVLNEEVIIETEFEHDFLKKCVDIQLNKTKKDKQFLKDLQKIKQGYYKISSKVKLKLLDMGIDIGV